MTRRDDSRFGIRVFVATCVAAGALSFVIGANSLWLLALNALVPRLVRRRKHANAGG